MLSLTLVLALSAAPPPAAAPAPSAQELAADLKATSAKILAGAPGPDVAAALTHLLDVLTTTAQDPLVPSAARAKLLAARKAAVPGHLLEEASIRPLREAYAALNDGTPFAVPDELDGMEAVTAYGRRLAGAAADALDRNDRAQATRNLLEFVLFVVTPIEAPPAG
jgi:hypothetical protein